MELISQHAKKIMEGCKERARDVGLRFPDDSLEYIVTNRDILELSSKTMIPTLYDYWVQDVEVLSPDQVQQEVQQTFECLQDDLECVWRDVQVVGDLGDRLTLLLADLLRDLLRLHPVRALLAGQTMSFGSAFTDLILLEIDQLPLHGLHAPCELLSLRKLLRQRRDLPFAFI